MENNSETKKDANVRFRRLSRIEAFNAEHGLTVESFLDSHGYTTREVRGIAKHAIALWETRPPL